MIKNLFKLFYLLLFLYLISLGSAIAENSKVDEISKNLRCLICQGQSVYDSNSDFALSVKSLISQKLATGKTEDDIYSFLKSKYGDFDVLINNAAFTTEGTLKSKKKLTNKFEDFDFDIWKKTIDINLTGAFLSCKYCPSCILLTS